MISDFLIQHLPPEAGPVLQSVVAHWDVAQPALVFACLLIIAAELALVAWWSR